MKHLVKFIIISAVFVFLTSGAVIAANMDYSSHGHDMKNMDDTTDAMEMSHPNRKGKMVRETDVDGYHLVYHLIDMQEQMNKMKAAGHTHEMNNTHHLMVYITDVDGNPKKNATVGYLVQTPDDAKQKAMCMAMAGGFGADINLKSSGTYEVKSKIVMGEETIKDTFNYRAN